MFIKKSEFNKLVKANKYLNEKNEGLEKKVNRFETKIEELEFCRDNPFKIELVKTNYFYDTWILKYFNLEIKKIILGGNDKEFELRENGILVETTSNKIIEYRFDIEKEILIQIKETDLDEETKKESKK